MIALSSSKFVKTLLALAGRPCTLGDAKALHRRRRRLTIALGGWLRRSAGFVLRGRFRLWRSGFRRCRRLLRAGPPCTRGDAESLDFGFGLGRHFRGGCFGGGRCRLLGAGPPCTRGDAESLPFGV